MLVDVAAVALVAVVAAPGTLVVEVEELEMQAAPAEPGNLKRFDCIVVVPVAAVLALQDSHHYRPRNFLSSVVVAD